MAASPVLWFFSIFYSVTQAEFLQYNSCSLPSEERSKRRVLSGVSLCRWARGSGLPLGLMSQGQSSEPMACVACTSASILGCLWTWLLAANSLPLQLAGSSWKRELLGNKSKQAGLPLRPRDRRGVPTAALRQPAGLQAVAGAGSHRAESGIARGTGVLPAGGWLRSENGANPSALPLLVSQLCTSGC